MPSVYTAAVVGTDETTLRVSVRGLGDFQRIDHLVPEPV